VTVSAISIVIPVSTSFVSTFVTVFVLFCCWTNKLTMMMTKNGSTRLWISRHLNSKERGKGDHTVQVTPRVYISIIMFKTVIIKTLTSSVRRSFCGGIVAYFVTFRLKYRNHFKNIIEFAFSAFWTKSEASRYLLKFFIWFAFRSARLLV